MTREFWDVSDYVGKEAQLKLIDKSSSGWGHINFDDLKGDISCAQDPIAISCDVPFQDLRSGFNSKKK